MIGAPLLLLIGITGPFEGQGDMIAQVALQARPAPVVSSAPPVTEKARTRRRVVRRPQRNDMTETLRAMNLMQIGMEAPAQRTSPNN
jgi:hypothetical protein